MLAHSLGWMLEIFFGSLLGMDVGEVVGSLITMDVGADEGCPDGKVEDFRLMAWCWPLRLASCWAMKL